MDLQSTIMWGGLALLVLAVGVVVWVRRARGGKRSTKPDKTYYGRRPNYAHFAQHQQSAA
jgi:hypothetical protein